MLKKRYSLMLIVVLMLVTILSGCQPAADGGDGDGNGDDVKEFVYAVVDDPATFDLDTTSWHQTQAIVSFDSLVEIDTEGNVSPKLAESWEISDDGLEWTFNLRQGIMFHCNEEEFTAHAVKHKFDHMKNPDKPSVNAHMISAIDDVVVVDDYTVKFMFNSVDGAIWNTLGGSFFAIDCPSCREEHGEDYGMNPCGTGPWILDDYVPGSHVTYVANTEYWGGADYWDNNGPPKFDKLTFRIIPDEATRILELQQGTVDYAAVPPQETKRLQDETDINVILSPSNGLRYWGFNMKKWPWTNKNVRIAMQYAIDKEAITESALEGLAKPLWSALPPSIPGYSEELEAEFKAKYPYDPAKTKEVLENDGWALNADGVYEKDGKPLAVSMWVLNEGIQIRTAEIIESNLKDVGVDLDIQVMEQATLTSGSPKGLHESLLWTYGWYDPQILFFLFNNGGTRMHYIDETVQRLAEEGHQKVSMEERLPIYEELQRYLADNPSWVVLYFPQDIHGFSPRVENVRMNPFGGGFVLNDIELK